VTSERKDGSAQVRSDESTVDRETCPDSSSADLILDGLEPITTFLLCKRFAV
jgi:hypothetical protein